MNDKTLSDCLSRAEMRALSKASNWQGLAMLVSNLAVLALAFALAIVWPNPVSLLLTILLLAGRQLAFAIVMHDCAHDAMFRSRWLNRLVGHWVGGAAIDVPLQLYRDYHLNHHKHAGTDQDPDQGLVKAYPVSRDSLRRKFTRDLTGQTGVKEVIGAWRAPSFGRKLPFLVFNAIMIGALTLAGAPWAYLLWWAARIFVFPAIMRLRNIGEHGVALNRYDLDPRKNTHTTLARWYERIFVAPNNVNYHLEHHMFAAIPPYNLPRFHRILRERGYYDGYDCVTEGYPNMLKKAVAA